jgi:hypothetical protein
VNTTCPAMASSSHLLTTKQVRIAWLVRWQRHTDHSTSAQ